MGIYTCPSHKEHKKVSVKEATYVGARRKLSDSPPPPPVVLLLVSELPGSQRERGHTFYSCYVIEGREIDSS